MRPKDNLEEAIKKDLNFTASARLHDQILDDVLNAQEKSKKTKSAVALPNIGRIIMKSRITRLATATVMIVAVIIGILHFSTSIDRGSIVLAEVIRNIEQSGSATWLEKQIFTSDGKEVSFLNSDAVGYYSSKYGARQDIYSTEGTLLHQVYWLPQENVRVRIVPPMMQYERTELTEAERLAWGQPNIEAIVELIESAQPTQLGRKMINGREAEGFQFTNPGSDVCFTILNSAIAAVSPISFESGVARFWIDVKTGLPVRYEAELLTHDELVTSLTGGKPVQVSIAGYETQWDVEIEPRIFEPYIPPEYTEVEWWPAGCYPAHDIPDQELPKDSKIIDDWLRQLQLNPKNYIFFYTTRLGHCLKLNNEFLADVALFSFQGESNDLRDFHDKLGTWFLGTPTATKAYYTKLDLEKVEQIFEYAESSDVLTILARPSLMVRNGNKNLVGINGFGSAVVGAIQKYKEQTIDLSFSFFLDEQATVDIPSVKINPDEALLIKFVSTTLPTAKDGTAGRILILIRIEQE